MMPAQLTVFTPADVSAFVDGELDAQERQDVAACAREDDRVARLIAAWQRQLGLLYAAFGRLCDEPLPKRLLEVLRQPDGDPGLLGGP
jgi:anti-sigma factor RsiW